MMDNSLVMIYLNRGYGSIMATNNRLSGLLVRKRRRGSSRRLFRVCRMAWSRRAELRPQARKQGYCERLDPRVKLAAAFALICGVLASLASSLHSLS